MTASCRSLSRRCEPRARESARERGYREGGRRAGASVIRLACTSQIIAPGDSKTVPGEGFNGGELVICFDVTFPKTLTPAQKKTIKGLGM